MILADFHTHTTFCDGKNTAAEMAAAACAAGLKKLGFSGHSHTPFDESYCMSAEETKAYIKEIQRLKEVYRGRLEILLGIEQDFYGDPPAAGIEYRIGSVHYVRFGDAYVPMDEGSDKIKEAADAYCGGDVLRVMEEYYDTVARLPETTGCDIIGHFDLPTKYWETHPLFDLEDPRYKAAWQRAADKLLRSGLPFEINTGAISRGVRHTPYPATEIMRYLGARGGTAVLSGDSHSTQGICFQFDAAEKAARDCGLTIRYPEKFCV